jgi:hypothetical protein
MSGVVEAANKVAEVQNRFVNYAGAFGKDIDKRKEQKRAKRKAALDSNNKAITDANKYFRKLDSDINLAGFSPEERKIIKDRSVQWRNEYYEISQQMGQLSASGIPLSGPQGQALQDQLNDIQQHFYDVEDYGKARGKGRQAWAANSELRPQGSDVSNDPYNSENINKANAVWTQDFKDIDPNTAEFYFDYNGENITMEDGGNYTMRPAELMNYLDAEYKKAGRESRQDPFTEAQLEDHEEYINNMFPNDPNVIASVLYSPIMKNVAYDDDIKERFDDAMDMADGEEKTAAIGAIREEMIGQFVTALDDRSQVAAEDYAANHPDKPSSSKKPPRLSRRDEKQIDIILAAQQSGRSISLPGPNFQFDLYRWNSNVELFVPYDKNGNPIMKDGKPADQVKLEDIVKYSNIAGLKLKDITK